MRGIMLLLVTLTLVGVITGQASAARRQDLVTGTLTHDSGVGVLPMPRSLTASASCSSSLLPYYNRYTYTSRVGTMLWRYSQQVFACFTGNKITSFQRWRWWEIPSLVPGFGISPWTFKGNVDNSCDSEHCTWTGSADSKFAMTRGWFEACSVPFVSWLCNDQYPLLTITVYSDRSYDHSERAS